MMIEGMYWPALSKVSLEQNIADGIKYYKEKYKKSATAITLNSEVALMNKVEIPGITVYVAHYIAPNIIWIGIDNEQKDTAV